LESLVNLEELWLGKNKITKLEVGNLSLVLDSSDSQLLSGSTNFEKIAGPITAIEQDNKIRGPRGAY